MKSGAPGPIEAFKQHGADFVVADNLADLVRGMNKVGDKPLIVEAELRQVIEERDRQLDNSFSKDAQITAIHGARNYRGDKLIRVATPHKLLDPKAGPLIAVRLNVLTRKTLGGLETDLDGRCLTASGSPLPGSVRRRRGQRLRRRRDDGLQRARGHLPRRLPVLRPHRRPRGRGPVAVTRGY